MKLEKVDQSHVKLYLGRNPVVLDIPSNVQGSYNPDEALPMPDTNMQLEWVYGYRGNDCRNNLLYLKNSNELAYFMAAVCVLYNVDEKEQRHYLEHTDDIKCIALHPDGKTLATGQVAGHAKKEGKPHVRIWSSETLETLHILGGKGTDFARAVCCVAFSVRDGGDRLCAVDEHDDHILSVWDWNDEKKAMEAKGSKDPVLDVEFNPLEANKIVSCGRGQITFWSITDEGRLERKRGTFKDDAPKFILGLAFSPKGFLASGDSNGNIHIWDKGRPKLTRSVNNAHTDAVFSVTFLPDGRMVSGGRAGHVIMWDENSNRKVVDTKIADKYGAVRCITSAKNEKIFIGTTKNYLLEGTFADGFTPVVHGHRDEIWGLAAHPTESKFITCADDRSVIYMDANIHYPIWTSVIKQAGHCAALTTTDSLLVAVGTQKGSCLLLNGKDGKQIDKDKVSREQIECIQFSPDGNYLAVGSRDNNVTLYEINGQNLKKIGKCKGHTSFVTHLDWSSDGKFLRTNSGDYELLFWKMPDCDREYSDDNTRDINWQTSSCTIDFNTCGIWCDANDGTDVNGCAANQEKTLVASADDFGFVNLYRYPCAKSKAENRVGRGHSSHVTTVQFLYGDNWLISVGGKDMSIMQWKLI